MKTPAQKLHHLDIQREADELVANKPGCVKILTDWETGFVKDVHEQVRVRGQHSLSDKQLGRIHSIYDKYFEA